MRFIETDINCSIVPIEGTGKIAVIEVNTLKCAITSNEAQASALVNELSSDRVMKPVLPMAREFTDDYPDVCFQNTMACNLNCRYCFVRDDPLQGEMELATAVKFLKKYCVPSKLKSPPNISFMGGEPLMNMDLICRVVAYCKKVYGCERFSLTTNGIRLKDSLADSVSFDYPDKNMTIGEWLSRNGFHLTLSLDGPMDAHNEFRINHNGDGSFADAMAGFDSLRDKAPRMLKRATFRATYAEGSSATMLDRLVFFNALIDRGYGGKIHIELAPGKSGFDMEQIADEHREATEWFISEVKSGKSPSWSDVVNRTLFRLLWRAPKLTSCGAGFNYVTCGVHGEFFACHRTLGAKIGSIDGGVDPELSRRWADNRVYSRKPCGKCDLKYICGGSCRAIAISEGREIDDPTEFECAMQRIRLQSALRMMAELSRSELERVCPNGKKRLETKK